MREQHQDPSSPGFPSLPSIETWMGRNLPEEYLVESVYQQPPLLLTPEEERLFKSFGDGLGDELGNAFDNMDENFDERQAVFAEAHAAGLFKGGIRRAAFSMGDLQAFQLPELPVSKSFSPPLTSRPSMPATGSSKAPSLESVPESKILPSAIPTSYADDFNMSTHISGISGTLSGGVLDGLALDQLTHDLANSDVNAPFASADVPMEGYEGEDQSSSAQLDHVPMSMAEAAAVKQEPLFGNLQSTGPFMPSSSHGFAVTQGMAQMPDFMVPTSNSERGYNYYSDASLPAAEKKPPLHPSGSRKNLQMSPEKAPDDEDYVLPGKDAKHSKPQRNAKTQALGKPALPEKDDKKTQQSRSLHRSQSALELRSLSKTNPSQGLCGDVPKSQHTVELTTPEGHIYTAGRLSNEERAQKILRYRQKRHERNFNKRIKYMCRKTLADSRPRVRGRFARNDDADAVMPHETKKALAEKAKKEKKAEASAKAAMSRQSMATYDRAKGTGRSSLDSDLTDLIPNATPLGYSYDPSLGSGNSNYATNFSQMPYGIYPLSSLARRPDENAH